MWFLMMNTLQLVWRLTSLSSHLVSSTGGVNKQRAKFPSILLGVGAGEGHWYMEFFDLEAWYEVVAFWWSDVSRSSFCGISGLSS